jgi:hypothetical protein
MESGTTKLTDSTKSETNMTTKTIKNRGLSGKVLNILNHYPDRTFSGEEMGNMCGVTSAEAGNALSFLVRNDKAIRIAYNCYQAKPETPTESGDVVQTILEMLLDGKSIKVQHLSAITEWTNATNKLLEAFK